MNADQDMKMLAEMNKAMDAAEKSSENKNTEHLSDFSTANLSFEDITAVLMDHTEDLFSLTGTQDRFSPEYLSSCRILLRAIEHLGSAFITKTALIARDFEVPKLAPLTARRLQEMVSFHIRKCDAAMKEMRAKGQDFSFDHYQLLLNLANASQRLRATQNRAFNVKNWFADTDRVAETGMTFTEHNGHYINDTKDYRPYPFRAKCAYGLRTEVLEEYEQSRKEPPVEEVTERSVPELPKPKSKYKTAEEYQEYFEQLFDQAEAEQPGLGARMRAANKKADAMGLSNEEKNFLFAAMQYEFVREMIISHVNDPQYCAGNPENAAFLRRIREILDG